MRQTRLTINKGSDRSFVMRVTSKTTGETLDLNGATNIQIQLNNSDRSILTLSLVTIPATKALAVKGDVTFTASVFGAAGNAITLNFNGTDTVQEIVDAWNLANPSNGVVFSGGAGTLVFASGSIQLSGGYGAYSPISIYGNPLLGKVLVKLLEKETSGLKTGQNQSMKLIIDYGLNPGGQRATAYYESKVDVVGDL